MKKTISLLLSIILLVTMMGNVSSAYAKDKSYSTPQYTSNYKSWSQNKSGSQKWKYEVNGNTYSWMQLYGCGIVAYSKLIYETGINRSSSFNPDVYFTYCRKYGGLGRAGFNSDGKHKGNGQDVVVQYAKSLGFNGLSRYGKVYKASDGDNVNKVVVENAKNGYYSICNTGGHYILINNALTKEAKNNKKSSIYIYNSYGADKTSKNPPKKQTLKEAGLSIKTVFTFKFVPNDCSVKFNANGGTIYTNDGIARNSPYTTKIKCGNAFYREMPVCLKDGYTFKGWYTETSGGSAVTSNTAINGNKTLYARWDCSTDSKNCYTLIKNHYYVIFAYHTDRCLTAKGVNNNDRVVQKSYEKSDYQIWKCTYNVDGEYSLRLKADENKVLDVSKSGNDFASCNRLQVYTAERYSPNIRQKFSTIRRSYRDGKYLYSIHVKASNKALDVVDVSLNDNAEIQQYSYNALDGTGSSGLNQLFYFVDVTDSKDYTIKNTVAVITNKGVTPNKKSATLKFSTKHTDVVKNAGIRIMKASGGGWSYPQNEKISKDTSNKYNPLQTTYIVGKDKEVNYTLSKGTKYYYQAYVISNGKYYFGSKVTFTTKS